MLIERYRWLAAVIAAHPNRTVGGRTRLQKTMRLLQRCGLPTSFQYTLYFYGPYSEGLQAEVGLLSSIGLIEETGQISQDGTPYFKISALEDCTIPEMKKFQHLVDRLSSTDPVVLELAATYDSFRELGFDDQEARQRLRRKKGAKCDNGRQEQAMTLLEEIDLLN